MVKSGQNSEVLSLKELLQGGGENQLAQLSFEAGLKLVEELVAAVETGTLPLDQAIRSYEKGVLLVKHLRSLLSGAEAKLKVLQKSDTDNS